MRRGRHLKKGFCLAVLLVWLTTGWLRPAPAGAVAAAGTDHLDPAELQALEEQLATELLTLNLQILNLEEDRKRTEQRLAELASSRAEEERRLTAAQAQLGETQTRLGVWVRHLYEEGRRPLLTLLFEARNAADFLHRLDLVRLLIEYEYGLLNEVRALNTTIEERLEHIAVLDGEARAAEKRIESRLAELERFRQRRAEFLAEVRGRSAALAERLDRLERQWQESLAPLEDLLRQLHVAVFRDLQPDRVAFRGRNVVVEMRAATINSALRRAAVATDGTLRVTVNPVGLTVTGIDQRGRSTFRVTGRLVPVSGGRGVAFRAEKVAVDGLLVDATAFSFLSPERQTFSLGERFQFMRVAEIEHEEDLIRFVLRPN